jgi:hypothetical protein
MSELAVILQGPKSAFQWIENLSIERNRRRLFDHQPTTFHFGRQ